MFDLADARGCYCAALLSYKPVQLLIIQAGLVGQML